jgi:short-subunit dehydrogenase
MRRVAVVTGASGGVGRATVRELARRGYDVGLIARGEAGLAAAAAEVVETGRRAAVAPADVAEWDQVDAAASAVTDELGPIDVWVNNAMTTVFAAIADLTPAELHRATAVTYFGQVHGAMAALARMRPRDEGTIVSVGSALAFRGIPMQSAYCGAKFAVRGFMQSLRSELLATGSHVRVCEVHLPAVNTTQFGWCRAKVDRQPMPVAPIYQPEVPARAIADIIESGARQDIVGSWNWLVVRLAQAMPGVGDHYMANTGISGQLTDQPLDQGRPDDLDTPVDDRTDFGAHGMFGDQAGGVLDPTFLRTTPHAAGSFVTAAAARVRAVVSRRWRR